MRRNDCICAGVERGEDWRKRSVDEDVRIKVDQLVEVEAFNQMRHKGRLDVGIELENVILHRLAAQILKLKLVQHDGRERAALERLGIARVGDDQHEKAMHRMVGEIGRGENASEGEIVGRYDSTGGNQTANSGEQLIALQDKRGD